MPVHAFVAAIRTRPEPAVLAFFNGGDEIFADFISRGFRVTMFVEDDLAKFFWSLTSTLVHITVPKISGASMPEEHCLTFIPVCHVVLLLSCFFFPFPRVLIKIFLLALSLHGQIMTEFALSSFLAIALFVEYAYHCFRIDAERYPLYLCWFE